MGQSIFPTPSSSGVTYGAGVTGSKPASPTIGQTYYDTTSDILLIWDGSVWSNLNNSIIAPVWTTTAGALTPTSGTFGSGNTFTCEVTATSAYALPITYTSLSKPSWVSMSSSGLLSGTMPSYLGTSGDIYSFTVSAYDGSNVTNRIFTITTLQTRSVFVGMFAGGGGGGLYTPNPNTVGCGGGGAGGAIYNGSYGAVVGTPLTITIGAGGTGGGGSGGQGANGNDTIFSSLTAIGGGAGGTNGNAGSDGGSGGGGARGAAGNALTNASGSSGNQGGGGAGSQYWGYGGGGYAGSGGGGSGTNSANGIGGAGGAGSSLGTLAGGGGGGGGGGGTGGAGGSNGGGTGSHGSVAASNGTTNTGGGGGGGWNSTTSCGNGGSGAVLIWYPIANAAAVSTTGSPTYTTDATYRYYQFNSSGSITL